MWGTFLVQAYVGTMGGPGGAPDAGGTAATIQVRALILPSGGQGSR